MMKEKTIWTCPSDSAIADQQGLEEELNMISKLPDELLSKILSRLSFNEAVRSSVLSSRWKNLWKFANLELDFDYNSHVVINGVVEQLQQGSKIRKFRAVSIDGTHTDDIDRWLEFAVSKRIESLELSFRKFAYYFSEDCYSHIKTPHGLSDIRSLRCLRLCGVELRDGIIEHFIANCPLLEELSLTYSSGLTRLRVVATSSLKHLEIGFCSDLEFIEIKNAPLLSSLVHASHYQPHFLLENCSSLVDLSLFTWNLSDITLYPWNFVDCSTIKSLSGCFAQLKSLYWETEMVCMSYLIEGGLVEYGRLERLAVKLDGSGYLRVNGLIPLLNACPRLRTLQLFVEMYDFHLSPHEVNMIENHQVGAIKMDHKNIEVVEIIGFRGFPMEREFIDYFMNYFVGLKKLVFDLGCTTPCPSYNSIYSPRTPSCNFFYSPYSLLYPNDIQGHEAALEFKSKAPKTLEVIVIR